MENKHLYGQTVFGLSAVGAPLDNRINRTLGWQSCTDPDVYPGATLWYPYFKHQRTELMLLTPTTRIIDLPGVLAYNPADHIGPSPDNVLHAQPPGLMKNFRYPFEPGRLFKWSRQISYLLTFLIIYALFVMHFFMYFWHIISLHVLPYSFIFV